MLAEAPARLDGSRNIAQAGDQTGVVIVAGTRLAWCAPPSSGWPPFGLVQTLGRVAVQEGDLAAEGGNLEGEAGQVDHLLSLLAVNCPEENDRHRPGPATERE
jgi:hypothetical protein